jgi:AcrR family transcriptional regulator
MPWRRARTVGARTADDDCDDAGPARCRDARAARRVAAAERSGYEQPLGFRVGPAAMPASHRADQLRPRKRPIQARSRRTVDAVLTAAAQLFTRRGYAGTTTNHIAERAGVSIGSLYEYFPSKDAILVALAEAHLDEGDRVLREAAAAIAALPASSLTEIARRIVRSMVALHGQDHELHRIFFEETRLPRRIRERLAAIEARTTEELAVFLAGRSDVAVTDRRLAAAIIVQTVEALTHRFVIHPGVQEDRDAYVEEIVRLIVGYLTQAPPNDG